MAVLAAYSLAGAASAATLDDSGLTLGNNTLTVNGSNIGFGVAAATTRVEVAANTALKLGNAYLSSGGNMANLAGNAWYNGSAWQIPDAGRRSALLQLGAPDIGIYQTQTAGGADWASVLSISAAGAVTMPKQPYFIAGHSGSTWISPPFVGWNKHAYGNVGSGNAGGWYSASANDFRAPVAGVYLFHATEYVYSAQCQPGYVHMDISVNENPISGGGRVSASYQIVGLSGSEGTYNTSTFATRILYLSEGDRVSVWSYVSGVSCYRYSDYAYFAGVLLR